MKKLDVTKSEKAEEETLEYTEYLDDDGTWGPNKGSFRSWDKAIELEVSKDYEHRYFLTWDTGKKPSIKRCKK